MRYRITHLTAYTYSAPAHESFNEVRLRPASDVTQTCLDFSLTIDPPGAVIAFDDYYGNAVHDFSIPYLHDALRIEATSEVITFAAADEPISGPREGEEDRSPALAGLRADADFADEHAEFLYPSAYVDLGPASARLAQELLAAERAASAYAYLRAADALVHDILEYRIGATTVHSTEEEVLVGRSGVCQDFSHVLIALCRHAGLPARYVSGYLGNVPESSASHAWAEVFIPPYGWIGMDATAGTPASGRHVKVAVGRDYADVSVVRGTYRGGAASSLEVTVKSREIADARSVGAGPQVRLRQGPIQYQTLGSMKQWQRLDAITQSLGAMTQSMGGMHQTIGGFPEQPMPVSDENSPRQQPQQQQQTEGETASPSGETALRASGGKGGEDESRKPMAKSR